MNHSGGEEIQVLESGPGTKTIPTVPSNLLLASGEPPNYGGDGSRQWDDLEEWLNHHTCWRNLAQGGPGSTIPEPLRGIGDSSETIRQAGAAIQDPQPQSEIAPGTVPDPSTTIWRAQRTIPDLSTSTWNASGTVPGQGRSNPERLRNDSRAVPRLEAAAARDFGLVTARVQWLLHRCTPCDIYYRRRASVHARQEEKIGASPMA